MVTMADPAVPIHDRYTHPVVLKLEILKFGHFRGDEEVQKGWSTSRDAVIKYILPIVNTYQAGSEPAAYTAPVTPNY